MSRITERVAGLTFTSGLLLLFFLLFFGAFLLSCSSSDSSKPCTLTVTSPNGGESWLRGTANAITWSSANAGGNVRIELYKDGVYYITLAQSTENDGSYETTFDDADASARYRVRVCSVSQGACCDESDADFSVTTSCDLTVTSPASGSSWIAGQTWPISWNPAGTGNVTLDLYRGTTYLCTIDAATPNDGSYQWVVDDCGGGVSSQYRVKVTRADDVTCYDYSDNFTIGQTCSIVITNPHSGSRWLNSENRTILWELTGGSGTVKLELYKGTTRLCAVDASTPNDGSYQWTVDDCGGGYASDYRMKISDTSEATCYAYSDYFTIGEPCAFTFSNPNATSKWLNGETRYILWETSGASGNVKLELYKGAGLLCTIVSSTPNDLSYTWVVSDCGGGYASDYRVRISDVANNSCYAFSEYFTIGEPCGFVFSNPSAVSSWLNGQTRFILWETSGASASVRLDLYKGASLLCPIVTSTDNDGSYQWLVTDCGGGFASDYRVKITDSVDSDCYSFSAYFTIGETCGFVFSNPSAVSSWLNGETRFILWETSGASASVRLDLYKGASLLCPIVASTDNDGSYQWLVSDCGGGFASDYRVKITDSVDSGCFAFSEYFTIGETCGFTITNPFAGSRWYNGDARSILWEPSGGSGTVKIELFKAAAPLCTIVGSAANTGSYPWVVSDCGGGYSTDYRVKITDSVDSECYAYSDLFSIGEPCGFEVTNPYASSKWMNGETRSILWAPSGGSGTVKLELYKADVFLCTIDASDPNDGSYSWYVNDCGGGYSTEYRVKITDSVDSECYAYSDLFTIGQPCSFAFSNPYSGSSWTVGQARTIMWSHTGGTGNVNLELYEGAVFLSTIVASTPNDGSHAWIVSDYGGGTSSEYQVKIVDAADPACLEFSATFTITVP